MTMFVLQTAILLAIAFAAGAVCGCLGRRWLHRRPAEQMALAPPPRAIAAPAPEPAPPAPEPAPEPEPVAPVAGQGASKAPKASRKPSKPAPAADDLKKINGIGRVIEARLKAAGVTTYAQIAAWKPGERKEWGEKLGFSGRVEREDWVGQAKLLAGGAAPVAPARTPRRKPGTA